jgi:medium-chain acyl-[acyl-carrier-protein] hydrolase
MVPAIGPLLNQRFALFGHSLGSLVAFELACRLQNDYGCSLAHLFVSGHQAPQLPYSRPPIHALPETEFVHEIKLLNGTPHEVLEHPDLMKLLLPLLRRDFRLVETYQHSARPPLRCPITAFGGTQDREANVEELELWRANTVAPFRLTMFPGDHFFIHSAQDLVLVEIEQALRGQVRHATELRDGRACRSSQ